jgi:histone acetyltransferase (RNA polymerase elongator complex component)
MATRIMHSDDIQDVIKTLDNINNEITKLKDALIYGGMIEATITGYTFGAIDLNDQRKYFRQLNEVLDELETLNVSELTVVLEKLVQDLSDGIEHDG